MARWIGILAAVIALLVGAVALAAVNLNGWLDDNRDMIAEQAKTTLGREVGFGEIGISLSGGLAVRLSDLRIADDPAFSEGDFLTASALDAQVAILPALGGNIEITRFVVRDAVIRVIKTGKGLSTDGLAAGGGGGAEPAANDGGSARALMVGLADFRNGTIEYLDRSVDPATSIVASGLDISASDVSLDGPIPFEFSTRLSGDLGGRKLDDAPLRGSGVVKKLDPPEIDLRIASSGLALQGPGGAQEKLSDLEINANVAVPGSGPVGTVTVRSPSGNLAGTDYRDLAIDVTTKGAITDITRLSVGAYSGSLDATGRYDSSNAKRPSVNLKTQIAGMDVALLSGGNFITGSLNANLAVQGAGAGAALTQSLVGAGAFQVENAVVHDFNPAGDTFRALIALPALAGSGLAQFAAAHPKVFGVGDTAFGTIEGQIKIQDGSAYVSGIEMQTEGYTLTGDGRYGLQGDLDFRTAMVFSDTLSADLLAREQKAKYLRRADGRIEIPVAIKGTPPNLSVVPDTNKLAQSATREIVTDKLVEALRGKDKTPAEGGEAAPSANPQDVGEELLRRGLGGLLGGGKE